MLEAFSRYIHITVFTCFSSKYLFFLVHPSEANYAHVLVVYVYCKLWSTSTGTSIRRLHIFVIRIGWGSYNHGVFFNEVKNMVVQRACTINTSVWS